MEEVNKLSSFVTFEKDSEVTDSCGDTVMNRVNPFRTGSNTMNGEKPETLAETTTTDDHQGDDFLREATTTDWSLLGSLATLVIKSIEVQVSLMLSFIKFPPWLIRICFSFVCDNGCHGNAWISCCVCVVPSYKEVYATLVAKRILK
ncbi:hypothetical protein Bca52824_028755 [Brassica carinata]|uniref:Uncharacterized protein n=1 Tax=Brassica carinata TaxID=52824 RepID=A0A8X8AQM5_BRACI|nr:hypothetical protein Bca52824_028755 [Brassica carinata]